MPEVDYLTNDSILPENQKYCVMSLFMDDDKKTIKYIRVSGAFLTVEQAQEQTQLLKEPGHYNFVAEMGTWNAFDPLPNRGDLNEQLNFMMKRYLMNMHKKNYEYEQRKYEMVIKNMLDNIKVKKDELKEYVSNNDEKMISRINEQIKSLEEKMKEYEEKLVSVNNKIKNVVIDSKYESVESSDNFNQNMAVKFEGSVKRADEKVNGQNWYCVSFLTENSKSLVGIKISGCFDTEENANSHSLALRDINDSFNVHVGELYKWQPFNPDPDSVEAGESEYANPQLNDTIKKKKENEQKAKLYHEYRKNEMIKKNIEDLLENKKKEHSENANKISNSQNEESRKNMEYSQSSIDEQIKKLEEKLKEYTQKTVEYAEKVGKPFQELEQQKNMTL
jgi:hypothetical protein